MQRSDDCQGYQFGDAMWCMTRLDMSEAIDDEDGHDGLGEDGAEETDRGGEFAPAPKQQEGSGPQEDGDGRDGEQGQGSVELFIHVDCAC